MNGQASRCHLDVATRGTECCARAAAGLEQRVEAAGAGRRRLAIAFLAGAALTGCANAERSEPNRWSASVAPRAEARFPARAEARFPEWRYEVAASPRLVQPGRSVRRGGGYYKVGKPYRIAGKWYVPREEPGYDRAGLGSWYGDDFHGRKTANGEVFDKHALTAAHPTLPMPSYVYVTNLDNGRTVLVRVNDRGPYAHGRIIDVSHAVAHHLDFEHKGLARVRVRYAGRAPLDGDASRERQHLAQQPWFGRSNRYSAFERSSGSAMGVGANFR